MIGSVAGVIRWRLEEAGEWQLEGSGRFETVCAGARAAHLREPGTLEKQTLNRQRGRVCWRATGIALIVVLVGACTQDRSQIGAGVETERDLGSATTTWVLAPAHFQETFGYSERF